jgi:L-threonylcarbamoyladenylate synthase
MPILPGRDPLAVRAAAAHLAQGELVAFPTETVYGLGARADNDAAVARVFAAKGRPADHPLIVHVADRGAAAHFSAAPGGAARRLMAAFWPGPLTVIVPRRAGCAEAASGGHGSIGLRMPAHPVALALLREAARLGVAGVAAPSANRFGRVSPTAAAHVQQELGEALWVLDGGVCEVGIESTIVDCTGARPALLRPGQLGRARIERVLGRPLAAPGAGAARAPGTLASHYAPGAGVHLMDAAALQREALLRRGGAGVGGVVGVYSRLAPQACSGPAWAYRAMPQDAAAVAHELFAVLRGLDADGVSAIWVERPPPGPEWDGVRDRLQRAAG